MTEGFIHCSTKEQLFETAKKHFPDQKTMMVLAIKADALGDSLVYEYPDYGGEEEFPHVYAPIPIQAVKNVMLLKKKIEGYTLEEAF